MRRLLCGDDGPAGIAAGIYFRLLLIGYFEGIAAERGIAWRAADSLALLDFLGIGLDQAPPDHSTCGGCSSAPCSLTLGLMFVFVLWRNERFILDHSHPDCAYYFPVRWWLIPHGLGGLIALVAGPFQFSSRLRRRHLQVHRMMGQQPEGCRSRVTVRC